MPAIISYLLGKFSLKTLWTISFYTIAISIFGFYVSFTLWFLQTVLYFYNQIDIILSLFTVGVSDELTIQIFGLLDCMGVIDGINAGLPFFFSALSVVFYYIIVTHMLRFYWFTLSVFLGFKP